MKVLIGIPLYNEQKYIAECIHSLYKFLIAKCSEYESTVLLLDDGSTDKSQNIYQKLANQYPFQYLRHEDGPRGYGNTILTLFQESKLNYDVLITFDADLQHAPFSIKEILDLLYNNSEIDLVTTSRYLSYRFWYQNTQVPVDRYVINMLMTRTINECFNLKITDAFCGLKGYRTKSLSSSIDHAGYAFPLVFWHYVSQKGLKLMEIETPIIYRLGRRSRGEWNHRVKEYFMILECLISSPTLKQVIRQHYKQTIGMLTEIMTHHSNFPIYTYDDFYKSSYIDQLKVSIEKEKKQLQCL
ncbi:MAG: glycosyltransferase family 2 protein [Candidatus Heimdallarchaeota archaeon]|nr:MAG: glycosyltransferase family 2 protein [Candidatus Heimdallarchaeota archaeon]